ncbi:unnamed protein product [Rotaria socialis]
MTTERPPTPVESSTTPTERSQSPSSTESSTAPERSSPPTETPSTMTGRSSTTIERPSTATTRPNPCSNGICENKTTSTATSDLVDNIVNGSNVTYERTVENVLNRNTWTNILAVVDVTGSMLPCPVAVYKWMTSTNQQTDRIKYYVFFNDGNDKITANKSIGSTGGLYGIDTSNFNLALNTMKTAMKNGNGGDLPENDYRSITIRTNVLMSLLTRLPNKSSQLPFFCSSDSLLFYLDDSTSRSQVLTLYNPYEFSVRYKVLCTAPRTYSIVEPQGDIHPQHSVDIIVRLLDISSNQNVVQKIRIQYYDRQKSQDALGKRDIACTILPHKPSEHNFDDDSNNSPSRIRTATNILQQETRDPIALVVLMILSAICAVILILPTLAGNENSTTMRSPSYLHMTTNSKIVASYILGLLTRTKNKMLPSRGSAQTKSGEATFSQSTGMIYIFNIIVGTGALALPKAFHEGGYVLSTLLLLILGFFSYISATYMIEAMAIANYMRSKIVHRRLGTIVPTVNDDEETADESDRAPLLPAAINSDDIYVSTGNEERHDFDIIEKIEMGEMADMFLNKLGLVVFYFCISLYLFGDLAIYGSAVPKSIRDVICTYEPVNCNTSITSNDLCWESSKLTRHHVYQIFVVVFFWTLGLFVFGNAQKTKFLQMVTTLCRWSAFLSMIILCIIHLAKRSSSQHPDPIRPVIFHFRSLPPLFGICVYSFMCHHSIPSIISPIRSKNKLSYLFAYDYICITLFYLLLSLTAVFTFAKFEDLYTLNFRPTTRCNQSAVNVPKVLAYYIALFPVFTLSSSFPIIGITLRNNLETVLKSCLNVQRKQRAVLVVCVLLIPCTVSILTENINFLVGFTGSYAGVAVQYVIPALLVYNARRQAQLKLRGPINFPNQSFFQNRYWVFCVLLWAWLAIIVITIYHILPASIFV